MIVTTWNNGQFHKTGAGYGFRVNKKDRNSFFNPTWESIYVVVENEQIEIELRKTFWSTCNELRSKTIGEFLINHNLESWTKGKPHHLILTPIKDQLFSLNLSKGD